MANEQRKQPFRKASIPKKKPATPVMTGIVEQTEDKLAAQIYSLMLSAKPIDEISKIMKMDVQTVYNYIELGKKRAEKQLVNLVGTFTLIAHERIEKYIIGTMIESIENSIKKGEFDPKYYELLMKGIKLQSEMLTSKVNSLTINQNNNTFIASGGDLYNDIVDMMREEIPKDSNSFDIIDADDIELMDMKIPKVDELIDKINS